MARPGQMAAAGLTARLRPRADPPGVPTMLGSTAFSRGRAKKLPLGGGPLPAALSALARNTPAGAREHPWLGRRRKTGYAGPRRSAGPRSSWRGSSASAPPPVAPAPQPAPPRSKPRAQCRAARAPTRQATVGPRQARLRRPPHGRRQHPRARACRRWHPPGVGSCYGAGSEAPRRPAACALPAPPAAARAQQTSPGTQLPRPPSAGAAAAGRARVASALPAQPPAAVAVVAGLAPRLAPPAPRCARARAAPVRRLAPAALAGRWARLPPPLRRLRQSAGASH